MWGAGKMLAVAREHWLLFLYPSKTGSGTAPAYKDDEYEDEEDEEVEEAPPKPNFSFIEVDAQCLTENGCVFFCLTPETRPWRS
jgi:hypothetical protein